MTLHSPTSSRERAPTPDPLHQAIADALGIPVEEVREDTSPASRGEWDSLANLAVIHEIEQCFQLVINLADALVARDVAGWRGYLRARGRV